MVDLVNLREKAKKSSSAPAADSLATTVRDSLGDEGFTAFNVEQDFQPKNPEANIHRVYVEARLKTNSTEPFMVRHFDKVSQLFKDIQLTLPYEFKKLPEFQNHDDTFIVEKSLNEFWELKIIGGVKTPNGPIFYVDGKKTQKKRPDVENLENYWDNILLKYPPQKFHSLANKLHR